MDRPRRRLSELTSQELSQRAIEYRRMAKAANGQATVSALDKLAIRYALLAAKREVEEASVGGTEAHQDQSEVNKLIELAAASKRDPVGALADIIRAVAEGDADPYLLMGVLLEGTLHAVGSRIPPERQAKAATAIMRLLTDRRRDNGLLPEA
jgi:hypothetical protein